MFADKQIVGQTILRVSNDRIILPSFSHVESGDLVSATLDPYQKKIILLQEKELIEVDEKYIINPETIQMDEIWINVDKFTSERSESVENHTWNESLEVNKFIGYKFIYENNDFLINGH